MSIGLSLPVSPVPSTLHRSSLDGRGASIEVLESSPDPKFRLWSLMEWALADEVLTLERSEAGY